MRKGSKNTAPPRPFTPRLTPLAERVDTTISPLEFPPEVEPRTSVVVRHSPVVPFPQANVPAGPAAPSAYSSRRVLWLVALLAACAPVAWLALRGSEPQGVPQAAAAPAASLAPKPILLASASPPSAPIETVATSTPVERRTAVASNVERRRPRTEAQSRPRSAVEREISQAPVTTAAPPPPGFQGALVIDSEPSGARVFVNGAPAGFTPLILKGVPVGSRVVRVEADAYAPWSSAVRVVANEQTRVLATLRR